MEHFSIGTGNVYLEERDAYIYKMRRRRGMASVGDGGQGDGGQGG